MAQVQSDSSRTIDPRLGKQFPEWTLWQELRESLPNSANVLTLGSVSDQRSTFPLQAVQFGNPDPRAPVLAIFGGVHGLERIGSQVALALLQSFSGLAMWDQLVAHSLEKIRVVFFPIVNPLGILHHTRSNFQGIDLMRSAPQAAPSKPTALVGGHRLSPLLPWYQGPWGSDLPAETKAILKLYQDLVHSSSCAITLDLHSGFGLQDRIWFPYANTTKPFAQIGSMFALTRLLEDSFRHHFYLIEPQAQTYTTEGDVWDYSFELFQRGERQAHDVYLPLALEMGSWLWVRKNPLQVFSSLGLFNPVKPHRLKRILRRHQTFFDFLLRSLLRADLWAHTNPQDQERDRLLGMQRWYPKEKNP